MTVLSACQESAIDLSRNEPSSLFSTTDQFAKELRTQANRTAVAVAKAYDWQKLMAIHTLTGDGTTVSFSLPSDYDRMLVDSDLITSSFGTRICKARDANQWLDFQVNSTVIGPPGRWFIVGGAIEVRPALESGDVAKFYYIKNTIAASAAAAAQTRFQADTDTFNLPERLITLGVIWRWRASKKHEYAEDLKNFEIAMSEEVAEDKGSRTIIVGRQRMPVDAELAHPAISV